METETLTPNRPVPLTHRGQTLQVPLAELQEFVQAAYDQHGILAEPSYATEAEQAPEALQTAHNSGVRA